MFAPMNTRVGSYLEKLRTPTSKVTSGGYQTSSDSEQLIYPADLGTNFEQYNGHCVLFEPNVVRGHKSTYTRPLKSAQNRIEGAYGGEVAMQNASINGGSIRERKSGEDGVYVKTNERIVLPMPHAINATYMANWHNTELGSIGTMGDLKDSVLESHFGVAGQQVWDSMKRTLAGAAQSMTGLAVKDYLEISNGNNLKPYVEVLFRGMSNRIIPFSFTMTPKNLKEAELVRAIVHRFKYHQAPEFKYEQGNNSFLLHPSTFDISFIDLKSGEPNPWLHRMSTCALTNISVNGTPGGEYSITTAGSLTSVTLDLMFTEMTLLTKQNYSSPTQSF